MSLIFTISAWITFRSRSWVRSRKLVRKLLRIRKLVRKPMHSRCRSRNHAS
jgi:hypothetical protein